MVSFFKEEKVKFLNIEWKDKIYHLWLQKEGESLWIHYNGQTWHWKPKEIQLKETEENIEKSEGFILSPMPGRIQNIFVEKGNSVKKGDDLLMISAMKMEYTFKAEGSGTVLEVHCHLEEVVDMNQVLMKIKYV